MRGSSGPASASAARSIGHVVGCVSARHRRPITSSWRSPSAARDRRAGVLDQPVAVEHPHEVGRVVDDGRDPRGRRGRLASASVIVHERGRDRAVRQPAPSAPRPTRCRRRRAGCRTPGRRGRRCARRARPASARAGASRRRARAARRVGRRADQHARRGTPTIRSTASLAVTTKPSRIPDDDALFERGRQCDAPRAVHRPAPIRYPTPRTVQTKSGDARVVGELAAQVGDVDVDEVVVAEPVRAPHALEQLRAAERDARLGGERVEQVELDPGQLERGAVERDLAGERVDASASRTGARGRRRRRSACGSRGAARPSRGRRARRRENGLVT